MTDLGLIHFQALPPKSPGTKGGRTPAPPSQRIMCSKKFYSKVLFHFFTSHHWAVAVASHHNVNTLPGLAWSLTDGVHIAYTHHFAITVHVQITDAGDNVVIARGEFYLTLGHIVRILGCSQITTRSLSGGLSDCQVTGKIVAACRFCVRLNVIGDCEGVSTRGNLEALGFLCPVPEDKFISGVNNGITLIPVGTKDVGVLPLF